MRTTSLIKVSNKEFSREQIPAQIPNIGGALSNGDGSNTVYIGGSPLGYGPSGRPTTCQELIHFYYESTKLPIHEFGTQPLSQLLCKRVVGKEISGRCIDQGPHDWRLIAHRWVHRPTFLRRMFSKEYCCGEPMQRVEWRHLKSCYGCKNILIESCRVDGGDLCVVCGSYNLKL